MKLRRDVFGMKIEDQANVGGMFFGVAQKISLACTWIEFGNFLPILQFGIKYIGWGPPDVESTKVLVVRKLVMLPFLQWCPTIIARNVIIDVDGMIKCKRPKR
eukprot:4057427-Ditylum_brightwellii.AAC.1